MSEKIKRIDYVKYIGTSENKPIEGTETAMSVLFNTDIISADEVVEILRNGNIEKELRVVTMYQIQADYLKGVPPEETLEEDSR